MSSSSGEGSMITVDNDYDRTNDFMVYDIDSDNADRIII
jgi:hypothetical protein